MCCSGSRQDSCIVLFHFECEIVSSGGFLIFIMSIFDQVLPFFFLQKVLSACTWRNQTENALVPTWPQFTRCVVKEKISKVGSL